MPFANSLELPDTLGEAHATVHRGLSGLLAEGIAGRASHGTAQLKRVEPVPSLSMRSTYLHASKSTAHE